MNTSKLISSRVVELYKLSKNVQGLKLLVNDNQQFTFKAGQWIDFHVPGLTQIAGYSICSSPEYFKETSLIELAVKSTAYPPTKWVHDQCKIDSQVQISVGGDFYYDINEDVDKDHDVLLLAGGVGINPLISILRHIARQCILKNESTGRQRSIKMPKVLLLYSAPKYDDLIFVDSIVKETSSCPNLSCEFLLTSEGNRSEELSQQVKFTSGCRLSRDTLGVRLAQHYESLDKVVSFVCGPNAMIDDLSQALLDIGLSQERIKFEKWW